MSAISGESLTLLEMAAAATAMGRGLDGKAPARAVEAFVLIANERERKASGGDS